MKNDDQMYQSILSRREEYRQTKKNLRRTIRRIAPALACACLAVVLGVGYWSRFRNIPAIPTLPERSQVPTAEPSAEAIPTETAESDRTEPISTTAPAPTETEPAATEETLLPNNATEPETSAETTSESSASNPPQQEQPHSELTETEQSQPSMQPPVEPTTQPSAQEVTGAGTITQDAAVTPEGVNAEQDAPLPHLLYGYAVFGEEQRIYEAVGLEADEKEIGDCIGEAVVVDGWDGSHRLTVKTYLVKERSAEECIAVYLPEEGYYLYQITADTDVPNYLQRS